MTSQASLRASLDSKMASSSVYGAGIAAPVRVASPSEEKVHSYFLGTICKKFDLPWFGASATSAQDATTSYSMLGRAGADLTYVNGVGGTVGDHVSMQAVGLSSSLHAGLGPLVTARAVSRFHTATRLKDGFGMAESSVAAGRGVAQASAGSLFLVHRISEIIIAMKALETSALALASAAIGIAGTSLFIVFYIGIAVWQSLMLWKESVLKNTLEKDEDGNARTALKQYELLEEKLFSHESTLKQMLAEGGATDEKLREKGLQIAKEYVTEAIALLQEKGIISEEDEDSHGIRDDVKRRELASLRSLQIALQSGDPGQIEPFLREILYQKILLESSCTKEVALARVDAFLKQSGLEALLAQQGTQTQKMYADLREKNEQDLTRLIGEDNVAKLKDLHAKGVAVTEEEKTELVDSIHKELETRFGRRLVVIGLVIAAAIILTLGFFITGGLLGVLLSIALFVVAVGMVGFDGYCFYEDYKAGKVGTKDPWLTGSSLGLGVAATVTAIVLITVTSGGIAPLIFATVIGVGWIALQVSQIYLSHRKLLELQQEEQEKKNSARTQLTEFRGLNDYSRYIPIQTRNATDLEILRQLFVKASQVVRGERKEGYFSAHNVVQF